jgi:hypothetical protein
MSQREKRGFSRYPPVFPVSEFEDEGIAPGVGPNNSTVSTNSQFSPIFFDRFFASDASVFTHFTSLAFGVVYPARYAISTRPTHECPAALIFAR